MLRVKRLPNIFSLGLLCLCLIILPGCDAAKQKSASAQANPVYVADASGHIMLISDASPVRTDSSLATPAQGTSNVPDLDDDDDYLDAVGTEQIISDPIEPWNRAWFTVNDFLIENVLSPVHKGYRYVTPSGFRKGVNNAYYNIKFPIRFVNCLLQGKGTEAGVEFSSFIVNSTAGFGGIFDVASTLKKKVTPDNEDGGQTFGVWGVGEGFYIVWPLLGPSNVRDTLGMGIDYFANPLNYMFDSWEEELAISGFLIFNGLDSTINAYETMKGMAVEPYGAIRDGYTQLRRAQIAR